MAAGTPTATFSAPLVETIFEMCGGESKKSGGARRSRAHENGYAAQPGAMGHSPEKASCTNCLKKKCSATDE